MKVRMASRIWILFAIFTWSKNSNVMPEKEAGQRKAAGQEITQEGGKSMAPPAFQLKAGDDDGSNGGKALEGGAAKAGVQLAKRSGPGYNTHTNGNAIVTIPNGATGTLPILVIVGGISYATKEWMKSQVPEHYFSNYILSFSNHGTFYTSAVKPAIEAAMTTDGVSGTYKALLGFSAGGNRIEAAKNDEAWSLLGMIDPTVVNGVTYPCPIYMIWNLWYDNTLANDPRSLLHNRVVNGEVQGSSVRDTKVGHAGMPKKWFELYGGLL